MRSASDLVREVRNRKLTEPSGITETPRKKRALAAFALAALTVIPAIAVFGPYASSVLAYEDTSPAAFFRSDRAMQQRARAARAPSAAPAPSQSRTSNERANRRNAPAQSAIQQAARPASGPLAYAPSPSNSNPLATIFGGGRQQTPAATISPVTSVPAEGRTNSERKRKRDSATSSNSGSQEGSGRTASGQAICVRLCDGFHFPVGDNPASGELAARESMCNALCPGAPVRLYILPSGTDDITQAYSPRRGGRSYGSLPVALRHTQKYDNTYTCRPQGQPHAELVPITQDFTLRKGDAVMTGSGFRVFNGATRWPYRNGDFVPLAQSRNVASSNRATLRAIERVSRIQPDHSPIVSSPAIAQPAVIPLPPRRPDQSAALRPAR